MDAGEKLMREYTPLPSAHSAKQGMDRVVIAGIGSSWVTQSLLEGVSVGSPYPYTPLVGCTASWTARSACALW